MSIKFLSKSQEQDIHVGLTKKIKFNRSRLNKWIKENPEHPDKFRVISEKTARIKELENLKKRFAIPYAYEP
jgi:hypothetical protein